MLKHTDIIAGLYYYIHYPEDGGWILTKTETKDDDYRWSGPCINNEDGNDSNMEFRDGSEDDNGGYFGGDPDCSNVKVELRYATSEEIEWLDQCIDAGELIQKPTQKSNTMEITELTKDMVGKKFTCSIEGKQIKDGRIQYANGSYYLCQNERSGSRCDDTLGYDESWSVGSGTKSHLDSNYVTNLYIVEDSAISSHLKPFVREKVEERFLIDGEIYSYQDKYLFQQKAKRTGQAYGEYYLNTENGSTAYGAGTDLGGGRYTTVSLEDKAWLNACIVAKKKVPRPTKIELNQEQMDFLIQAMLVKSED